jgi:putative effector of murein hydrolase LrgA (UPF0299 family)
MTVLFFVGFVPLARFLPPPPPTADAATIAAMYTQNAVNIRIGMFLVLIVAGLFLTFGVAVAVQTRRIESAWQPIMTYLQLPVMAVCAVIAVFCAIFWEAAAFRPDDTSPDVTRALNDLGWFTFLWPWVPFSLWCLAIAVPILQDRSDSPVYPRWVAYLNIWTAIFFVPAGIIVFTKTGPLAWDGVFAFYIPLFVFFGWVVAMSVMTFRAISAQEAAAVDRTAVPA